MRVVGRAGAVLICLLGLAWAGAVATLWVRQESLIFKPVPLAADVVLSAEPGARERFVDVPGARLSVLEVRRADPRGVVLFLHGNGGNLQKWLTDVGLFRDAGFDVVAMDYRGFGKSSGRIESEAQMHADVEAVWQSVAARYAGRRVVVYGRSLGSGLAAAWASKHQPDLTILVSPFTSMVAMATEQYPWVPSFALRYPLRSDQQLPLVKRPVLLLHGDRDALIAFHHSEQLSALVPQARLVRVAGAGHGDVHRFETYQRALADSLLDLR